MAKYGVDITLLVSFVVEAESYDEAEREALDYATLLDAVRRGNYEYDDCDINEEEDDA